MVCKCSGAIEIPGSKKKFLTAQGIAICSKDDEFDMNFGRQLARARADQKLEKKFEKALINYSYKKSKKMTVEYILTGYPGGVVCVDGKTYRLEEI